jgi:CMP-N,N'-diacetyllegionaminic acid synthase
MQFMKVLAIIPARSGSKGLPGKNIKSLCGKPLIGWTIEAALRSKYINKVVVSTNDPEIAQISKDYGASVPFIRPEELSTDSAPAKDAILHCLDYYKNKEDFSFFVLLQPTSPLRDTKSINKAFELLYAKNAKSVISVCEADHHPYWMNKLNDELSMNNFVDIKYTRQGRQKLPVFYRINGAIYISEIKSYLRDQNFYGPMSYAYVMDKQKSVDIDDLMDFYLAETIIKNYVDRGE